MSILSCKKENNQIIEKQFDDIYTLIKEESIYNEHVNWTSIYLNVKDSIKAFNSLNDKYIAIEYVLSQLPDQHAFFLHPNDSIRFLSTKNKEIPKVHYKIIDKTIGYIKINGFAANDSLSKIYSSNIRKALLEIDQTSDLDGWILDVRNNQGGKVGTFALGISPLYSDSIIGYSKTNKLEYKPHKISKNSYHFGSAIINSISQKSTLSNSKAKIAILVNKKTASLAEFLALTLKSQKNTRIFGQKTTGFTTDLMTYQFVSGAEFGFSTSYMCDRDKKEQITGLIPDVTCSDGEEVNFAIKWIKNAI
ncbi:Peptidase family S41 [Maribacter orientalis]|uniref:Peptidase family S41 n=2 Tax=Maribacter orientalis TaxID=228957 RepID=A0A1H7FPG5_9FLAO|nr:Peptidase family S41 [Maribacter orientalis]|tara:strand:- start:33 stop:950 length:918 start_codon:yes stop_codon:yes gene_type:complete